MVGKVYRVMFSRTAKRRLKEIIGYAEQASKSRAVGQKVRRGILLEAKKLEKLPDSKPILPDTEAYGYKVRYTKAWNFKIIFRVLEAIGIVRLMTIRHDSELDESVRKDLD